MNLKEAVAVAKGRIGEMFAADAAQNIRLESFLYDDHLMVWSLTIGFTPGDAIGTRILKLVRVSEANKAILSVKDA
jgi:hypothetical protein